MTGKLSFRVCRGVLGLLLLLNLTAFAQAPAPCPQGTFRVIMATPVSSRIDRKGDRVRAVLAQAVSFPGQPEYPSGAILAGQVDKVQPSYRHQSGQLSLLFIILETEAGTRPIQARVATVDGWLRQGDQNTPVWHVDLNHSTRLLNDKIQQRLGANRAVWASVLGINENTIPDPTSDEFIEQYNRRDVLVGAGDTLTLKWVCP